VTTRRRRRRFDVKTISRDTILFAVGLLGIAYETLIADGIEPTLLVMFGAMVGLPAFLHTDEKAKQAKEDDEADTPAPAKDKA